MADTRPRQRKSVWEYTPGTPEFELLVKAFKGVMALDPSDPKSYFSLAGYHGFPKAVCQHHEQLFLCWHRQYLLEFENALRSIEGCEDVSLPFFDVISEVDRGFPEWCYQAPFDGYEIPEGFKNQLQQIVQSRQSPAWVNQFWNNGRTARQPNDVFVREMQEDRQFFLDGPNFTGVNSAMHAKYWSQFSNDPAATSHGIESFHDTVHVNLGGWMSWPTTAAFDPVFWFHHSNVERLWCVWQEKRNAITKEGLEAIANPPFGTDKYVIPWDEKFPSNSFQGTFGELIYLPYITYGPGSFSPQPTGIAQPVTSTPKTQPETTSTPTPTPAPAPASEPTPTPASSTPVESEPASTSTPAPAEPTHTTPTSAPAETTPAATEPKTVDHAPAETSAEKPLKTSKADIKQQEKEEKKKAKEDKKKEKDEKKNKEKEPKVDKKKEKEEKKQKEKESKPDKKKEKEEKKKEKEQKGDKKKEEKKDKHQKDDKSSSKRDTDFTPAAAKPKSLISATGRDKRKHPHLFVGTVHNTKVEKITATARQTFIVQQIDRTNICGGFRVIINFGNISTRLAIFQEGPTCEKCQKSKFMSIIGRVPDNVVYPCDISFKFISAIGEEFHPGDEVSFNIRQEIEVNNF